MLHLVITFSTLPVWTFIALDIVPLAEVIVGQQEDERNGDDGDAAGGDEEVAIHACVRGDAALADVAAHVVPAERSDAAVNFAERRGWD